MSLEVVFVVDEALEPGVPLGRGEAGEVVGGTGGVEGTPEGLVEHVRGEQVHVPGFVVQDLLLRESGVNHSCSLLGAGDDRRESRSSRCNICTMQLGLIIVNK